MTTIATPTPIEQAQDFLRASPAVDAWLVYDYQGMNPALADVIEARGFLTRPVFLLVTPGDKARLLVSAVDAGQTMGLDLERVVYRGREDAHRELARLLKGMS